MRETGQNMAQTGTQTQTETHARAQNGTEHGKGCDKTFPHGSLQQSVWYTLDRSSMSVVAAPSLSTAKSLKAVKMGR